MNDSYSYPVTKNCKNLGGYGIDGSCLLPILISSKTQFWAKIFQCYYLSMIFRAWSRDPQKNKTLKKFRSISLFPFLLDLIVRIWSLEVVGQLKGSPLLPSFFKIWAKKLNFWQFFKIFGGRGGGLQKFEWAKIH